MAKLVEHAWRKSSYTNDNACVEVRLAGDGVRVRDSKNPDGGSLAVPAAGWRALLGTLTRD
jgi:uncharacterized protein DUF397